MLRFILLLLKSQNNFFTLGKALVQTGWTPPFFLNLKNQTMDFFKKALWDTEEVSLGLLELQLIKG